MSFPRMPRIGAVLLALLAFGACGDDDPVAPRHYMLEVMNHHPHTMVVSFEDSAGAHELGPVEPATTRTFEVHDPREESVTVVAVNEARTHTMRIPVTLQADRTVSVEIKMMNQHGD